MRTASLASGIGTEALAWKGLGFDHRYFAEVDPFASEVLNQRHPGIPNLGDMTKIQEHEIYQREAIDALVAGTPCQSFSIAGLRKGMDDPRGNLTLELIRILSEKRPRWLVWENVPQILRSYTTEPKADSHGHTWQSNDFGVFIAALREIGYSVAWRVLDAQYFGIPQQRRRIFVVGYRGDKWGPPTAVLFDRKAMQRITRKSRKNRKAPAGRNSQHPQTYCIKGATIGRKPKNGPQWSSVKPGISYTLTTEEKHAFWNVYLADTNGTRADRPNGAQYVSRTEVAPTVTTKQGYNTLVQGQSTVRFFTPIEWERLQGFPDNYTNIDYRGKPATDGNRCKAIGNAIAVPVLRWIGKRLKFVDELINETA